MPRSVYSSATALDPGRAHPSGADSNDTALRADETKEAHPWPAVPPSTLRRRAPFCASATAPTPITAWTPPAPKAGRGYGWMFAQHIGQADAGCDFDFLTRSFGTSAKEPDIF